MPPKSEPESTPEPEHTPRPNPEGEPKGEPLPEWSTAIKTWGAGWPSHWIGNAVIFALLSIVAIILLRRLYNNKRQRKAMVKFSVTVTALIIIFLVSRFLYLIINPYESPNECLFGMGKCPLFLSRLLFSIGIPSLVSAFLLVHLALLDVMKFQKLSRFTKLQDWRFLMGLVSLNYVFSCVADLVVSYKATSTLFLILCQIYFIIFSAGLVACFSYTGVSIYLRNKRTKSQVYKLSTRNGMPLCAQQEKNNKKSIKKVLKLTIITVFLGLCFLISQLYSLVTVYTDKSNVEANPKPWPWLICQYVYRLIELLMAACLLFNISYMPKQKYEQEASKERRWGSSAASKYVPNAESVKEPTCA